MIDHEALMSSSLAPKPPPADVPPTLEGAEFFRVKTAALSRPAAPDPVSTTMILVTAPDGGVVVYAPSDRLIILAARRRS